MVEQVSAVGAQKVYSSDKKIYSGMTVREGGKSEESYEIFNLADKDKNGVISEKEIKRYDGPVINFSKNVSTERSVGTVDIRGRVGIRKLVANGDISLKNIDNYELYPGLTIEEADYQVRDEFVKADANKNGELSLAEMVRLQIKIETGYDVEVSENMTRTQMRKLIRQKRNEYDNEQLNQIREKINSIPSEKRLFATHVGGGAATGAGIAAAGTAAFGEGFGLGPLSGAIFGGFFGLMGFVSNEDDISDFRYEVKKQLFELESKYTHTSEIMVQIKQMKKDNPWLAE